MTHCALRTGFKTQAFRPLLRASEQSKDKESKEIAYQD